MENLKQILKIEEDKENIKQISNPCEDAQCVLVNKDASYIRYIDNPCEKAQLMAVTANTENIKFIRKPCEQAQITAVFKDVEIIKDLSQPCEKAQLMAVTANAMNIENITQPCENVQIYTVLHHPELIGEINNPCSLAQILSVNENPNLIREMSNPDIKTRELALAKDATLKEFIESLPQPKIMDVNPSETEDIIISPNKRLTIEGDKATIIKDGKTYDASDMLAELKKNGVNPTTLTKEDWASLLQGQKLQKGGNALSIVKSTAGYSMRIVTITRQMNAMAQVEI